MELQSYAHIIPMYTVQFDWKELRNKEEEADHALPWQSKNNVLSLTYNELPMWKFCFVHLRPR